MTEKEKALELIDKYQKHAMLKDFGGMDFEIARRCAIIGLDEMLDQIEVPSHIYKWFKQVRVELERVEQQSELLKAFCSMLLNAGDLTQQISDDDINSFIKAFNCAQHLLSAAASIEQIEEVARQYFEAKYPLMDLSNDEDKYEIDWWDMLQFVQHVLSCHCR